jgi:hypothetical protein
MSASAPSYSPTKPASSHNKHTTVLVHPNVKMNMKIKIKMENENEVKVPMPATITPFIAPSIPKTNPCLYHVL